MPTRRPLGRSLLGHPLRLHVDVGFGAGEQDDGVSACVTREAFDGLVAHGDLCDVAEDDARRVMSEPSYRITMKLGPGKAKASYVFCDIGEDYLRLNAAYRS